MGSPRFGISFGALSPPLVDQLAAHGIEVDPGDLEQHQKDATAIARLAIRGIITESQAHAAHKKVMRGLAEMLNRRAPTEEREP